MPTVARAGSVLALVRRRTLPIVISVALIIPLAASHAQASHLDGSYIGSYSGSGCNAYGCANVSGTVSLTVSGTSIRMTQPGSGSGSLANDGAAGGTIPVSIYSGYAIVMGYACTFSGSAGMGLRPGTNQLRIGNGRWSASCEDGITASGGWHADGPQFDADKHWGGGTDDGDGSEEDYPEEDYPECDDYVDNDRDGDVDYPDDPGCKSSDDESEDSEEGKECGDGIDNDGDGLIDYEEDPGCSYGTDDSEDTDEDWPECRDERDNDGDGETDYPDDGGCSSSTDDDEEDPPTVSIADADIFEGDSDRTMNFRVSLSKASKNPITVNYVTGAPGDTATKGRPDYIDTAPLGDNIGTLTFNPGFKSKLLPVIVDGDRLDEPGPSFGTPGSVSEYESLTVRLRTPKNAILGQATATGRIYDNDGPVVEGPSGATVGVVLEGSATITPPGGAAVPAGPNVAIGEGAQIVTTTSPATIILSDGSVIKMDAGSTLVWREPTLFNQPRGTVWYSLMPELNARWTYRALNARVVTGCCGTNNPPSQWGERPTLRSETETGGSQFTIETSKQSDRVRVFGESVEVAGVKGRAVTVEQGFETSCVTKKACSQPVPVTSECGRYWDPDAVEPPECRSDPDDTAGLLDLKEVHVDLGDTVVDVTFTTWEPWKPTDLSKLDGFNINFDSKGADSYDRSAFVYYDPRDKAMTAAMWVGGPFVDLSFRRPDSRSITITFDRARLKETKPVRWQADSDYKDVACGGRCRDSVPDEGWVSF